ncbi:MAG: alpha-hydroxy-acid oxidizing protein [Methylobacteriaceae bacterium]|nr:alpha-hydroxy-acid oxidizing protein [Methylobacteriaceae bacterium]
MAVRIGLDGAMSPIEALPDIRAVAGGKLRIFAHSDVRRGSDIVKALALAADFILLGRAAMFAVAAGGEAGVAHALSLLKAEVDANLGLLGCPSVDRLDPGNLHLADLFPQSLPGRAAAPDVRPLRPALSVAPS